MSKEFHPLVSIVIPVYNGANYMREAIDSALAQTYPNIEVLVINDGSTDDGATHDIAISYGEKVRYFQKENGGVVSALNFGIENMRGEYFAWLSHDDFYLPEKIEKQVAALKKYKGSRLAFCVCNCTFVNEVGIEMFRSYVSRDCTFDNPRCFLFLETVDFNGIMVLIPKILFDICGRFTPSLATHEYDMWSRILDVADVVVEPDCLSCMRIHPNQVSSQRKKEASLEIDSYIGKGIQDISPSVFEAFIAAQYSKKGIQYIFDLFNSYMWYQHLPITSVEALKQFRLMCERTSPLIDDIYSSLLGYSNIEGVKALFAERRRSKKELIVIQCENLTYDLFKGMLTGITLLLIQYDIFIFYHTIDDKTLQLLDGVNIRTIKLMYHLDFNMPLCLGLLSYLLKARVFWYYSTDNRMQYSKVFHFLKSMEIYSIASYQDIDNAFINRQDNSNTSYIDHKKYLSKASLITSHIAHSVSGLFDFQNIITVEDEPLQALVRWKMIFDVLLMSDDPDELENRISNDLSAIFEKSHTDNILENQPISLEDYINNYIRDFLNEVDLKAIALINAYEQRRFWKLTKPLRSCVWFFRKANKAIYLIMSRKKTASDILYQIRMMIKNRRIPV